MHRLVKGNWNRIRTALWAATAAFVVVGCEQTPRPPTGPSVLLITLDTTRADRLSCYGCPEQTSPNLDRLAEQGALFTRAFTQAAVTPVSHASILTGQNPYTHGLRVMHGLHENRLRESCETLAEVMRDAGYRTAAFVSAFPVTDRFGLHQGFETFDADFIVDSPAAIVTDDGVVNTNKNQRRADVTTDRALSWLTQTREPFFVWLHYFDPHDIRLLPPREFMNAYQRPAGPMAAWLRATYDIEIRFMDRQIGRVFEQLEQSGRLDDTVVIVVADHGEGLGDHDWWTHGILYQEQIHTPLILRAPGVAAGKRVDHVVRTIDIMPTVLELAGIKRTPPPTADGTSLVPLLNGAADPGHLAYADSINMLTYSSPAGTRDEKNEMLFSVTDGTWKYIHHLLRPAESELYNLEADPRELANLRESHPEQAARLLADLRARNCFPTTPLGREQMSAEDLARLRALGYITDTQPAPSEGD